jgi:predicted transposase YdaD
MLHIDFIDTETGKQVFKEGQIIEAQNGIIETIQARFNERSKNSIQTLKGIGDLKKLSQLRQYAATCQSKDDFLDLLAQSAPEKKWRKQSKKLRRGTDEAFLGLINISGKAVLKLVGIDPVDAESYTFKSIVLKEKKLEPDIVGFPVLESNKQKVFMEFQAYAYPFIKYNLVSKALMACDQDKDQGKVLAVIIYTEQKYKDAALSIQAFDKPIDEGFDHQIKEVVLTDYTLDQLLAIDSRLIVLAPFTVSTETPLSTLTAHGRQWKKSITTAYENEKAVDAINVMSLFILNRFRFITREGLKAMLDFDILDTVAGRQVYDEGIEKGRKEEREEGLSNMKEMLEFNLKNKFGDVASDSINALHRIKDYDYLKELFSTYFVYDNYELFKRKLVTANI